MIQFIFIFIVILSLLFYTLYLKRSKNEQFENNRHKWENPIKTQLQEKGFKLVKILKPTLKEVLKSYPFIYFKPTVFISGQSSRPFGEPVDFKIIFTNQNSILYESWLQITENTFNGNITFDWQPNLEIFTHLKE